MRRQFMYFQHRIFFIFSCQWIVESVVVEPMGIQSQLCIYSNLAPGTELV